MSISQLKIKSSVSNFFTKEYCQIGFDSKSNLRTKSEVDFIVNKTLLKPQEHILDLCCGVGRHAKELARRGFKVTAVDINEDYLKKLKSDVSGQEIANLNISIGDMSNLCFKRKFNVIINFFGSFGYYDDQTNNRIIKDLYSSLHSGGRLLIDVKNRDYVLCKSEFFQTKSHGDITVEKRCDFECSSSRLYLTWRYLREKNVIKETTFNYRLYSCHELCNLMSNAGFWIKDVFGNIQAEPICFDSERIIIIGVKS